MDRTINDSSFVGEQHIFPDVVFLISLAGWRVHHLASRAHLCKSKLECACWHSNETRHPPIVSASFLSLPRRFRHQHHHQSLSSCSAVDVLYIIEAKNACGDLNISEMSLQRCRCHSFNS